MRKVHRIVLVVIGLLLAPAAAWAQGAGGSGIAGVVHDTSGAVLPGVTVEAASPALIEKVRSAVTDGRGLYSIADLRPGAYEVTFTMPGFSTIKRSGVELTVGFTATVNADMAVGALEETVTVSGPGAHRRRPQRRHQRCRPRTISRSPSIRRRFVQIAAQRQNRRAGRGLVQPVNVVILGQRSGIRGDAGRASPASRAPNSRAASNRAPFAGPTPGVRSNSPGGRAARRRREPSAGTNRLVASSSALRPPTPVPRRMARSSGAVNA